MKKSNTMILSGNFISTYRYVDDLRQYSYQHTFYIPFYTENKLTKTEVLGWIKEQNQRDDCNRNTSTRTTTKVQFCPHGTLVLGAAH